MSQFRPLLVWLTLGLLALPCVAFAYWDKDLEARRDHDFAQCIRAFEEKRLEPLASDRSQEVYRVLYLPSFDPQVSMRVNVWPSGTGRMTLRRIPPYCSDRNPNIYENTYGLAPTDVALVREAFARADFWRLATTENGEGGARFVCSDGAGFHMEALRDGRHHRLSRSCVWSGQLDEIVVLFHRLAKIKDPHRSD